MLAAWTCTYSRSCDTRGCSNQRYSHVAGCSYPTPAYTRTAGAVAEGTQYHSANHHVFEPAMFARGNTCPELPKLCTDSAMLHGIATSLTYLCPEPAGLATVHVTKTVTTTVTAVPTAGNGDSLSIEEPNQYALENQGACFLADRIGVPSFPMTILRQLRSSLPSRSIELLPSSVRRVVLRLLSRVRSIPATSQRACPWLRLFFRLLYCLLTLRGRSQRVFPPVDRQKVPGLAHRSILLLLLLPSTLPTTRLQPYIKMPLLVVAMQSLLSTGSGRPRSQRPCFLSRA